METKPEKTTSCFKGVDKNHEGLYPMPKIGKNNKSGLVYYQFFSPFSSRRFPIPSNLFFTGELLFKSFNRSR